MVAALARVLARVLASGLVAIGALAVPPATAAPTQPSATPALVRVGSFNIDRDRDFGRWRAALLELRRGVDVAGLQEVSTAAKRRFLSTAGWGAYGAAPGPDENPVVWDRSDFRKVGARAAPISGRQGHLPASYATVVRLVHRASGQRYAVLNVHLVWNAVEDGRKVPGQDALYRYYVAQVRGLARAVGQEQRRAGTRVLVIGDFNVDHRHDRRLRHPALPAARLGGAGLVSAWDTHRRLPRAGGTSTLGAGYIDNVWAGDEARAVRALRGVSGGQHRPVVARYRVATSRVENTPCSAAR